MAFLYQHATVIDEIEHKLGRYELWDFLAMMRLLEYPVGSVDFIRQLPKLVPPADPRSYSIVSAPTGG